MTLEREPISEGNAGQAMDGPPLSEEEHEVVLTEERPVVETEAVPVERVCRRTQTSAAVRRTCLGRATEWVGAATMDDSAS